ncbi:nuclear transport factor 2 family protein [Dermacoccus nishinomiyaensis]|uniref:nuclear transport factor 2 family protein n=1 Tax=Dermacoccus nishinomiyaensis TaxID=1274 RepID=UPI0033BAE13C
MDSEAMQRQLRDLVDRAAIVDVLDRYLLSLDEGVFDEEWARAFPTENVTAAMPIDTVHGRAALLARVRRGMGLFERTVHLGTNTVVDINGDRATARGALSSPRVSRSTSSRGIAAVRLQPRGKNGRRPLSKYPSCVPGMGRPPLFFHQHGSPSWSQGTQLTGIGIRLTRTVVIR